MPGEIPNWIALFVSLNPRAVLDALTDNGALTYTAVGKACTA